MREWLAKPGFLGFYGTIGSDMSQLMAMFFTTVFIIGWVQARRGLGNRHHWIVFGGIGAMLAYFVSYYLFRQLGVLAFEGREGFGGPDWVYHRVFTPLLTIHITLVVIGLVMAVYLIILGFRVQVFRDGRRLLRAGALLVRQGRVLRIFWGVTVAFLLAFLLRTLLSEFTLRRFMVYVWGIVLVGAVLGAERLIERTFPDGERRHRRLGTFTMIIYCVLLVTGTLTYSLLYVFWPPPLIE